MTLPVSGAVPQKSMSSHLIRYVRTQLGQDAGYGVEVELSDAQIVTAIRDALSNYSKWHPVMSYQAFTAMVGSSVHTPDPPLSDIINLSMIPTTDLAIQPVPHIGFYNGIITGYGTTVDYNMPYRYAAFMEWKQATEMVFSQTPAWVFLPEANKLYIYSPSKITKVSIVGSFARDAAFDEDDLWSEESLECGNPSDPKTDRLDLALTTVKPDHMIWVRELTLARSMVILGRIRAKYGSIPQVEGKEVQLDGEAMKSEGNTKWEETLREVKRSTAGKYMPTFA